MGVRDRIRGGLKFANVVSLMALFVALGGTSYAAITITGRNVANGTLTGKDLKDGSVGTLDVKNGGLLAKDFKAGQLPAGPQGPKGDNGLNGKDGANGGTHVRMVINARPPSTGTAFGDALCEPGEHATGGGSFYSTPIGPPPAPMPVMVYSRPHTSDGTTPDGWTALMRNDEGSTGTYNPFIYAMCASP